jgi:hypothetical protein
MHQRVHEVPHVNGDLRQTHPPTGAYRGWRCAGAPFQACRRHRRVGRHSSPR